MNLWVFKDMTKSIVPDLSMGIGLQIKFGKSKASSTILGMSSFKSVSPFLPSNSF